MTKLLYTIPTVFIPPYHVLSCVISTLSPNNNHQSLPLPSPYLVIYFYSSFVSVIHFSLLCNSLFHLLSDVSNGYFPRCHVSSMRSGGSDLTHLYYNISINADRKRLQQLDYLGV